jgi:hypothetical protein
MWGLRTMLSDAFRSSMDGTAAWPAPVPGRLLMERIVSQPSLLREYREQASTDPGDVVPARGYQSEAPGAL